MPVLENGQTCLEKKGIDARHKLITRSDYNINNQYGASHTDAKANNESPWGKGTGGSGHGHSLPNCGSETNAINYSNFNTESSEGNLIGGLYDRKGRNGIWGREGMMAINTYNSSNEYGKNIDTTRSQEDGQFVVKDF